MKFRAGVAVLSLALTAMFTAPAHLLAADSTDSAMPMKRRVATLFAQTALDSDISGQGTNDPNLKNGWGLAFFPGNPFWVADNGSGVSTLYDGKGAIVPLIVKLPTPTANSGAASTGLVANTFAADSAFMIPGTNAPALFIFATENGTIVAWNQNLPDVTEAVIVRDNSSSGAVYKGLAAGSNSSGDFLCATNFTAGNRGLTRPSRPQPFGVFIPGFKALPIRIEHQRDLYVTYAKRLPGEKDEIDKLGLGFVDVYDTDGNLKMRFAKRGQLDAPWGVAVAPASFGDFANDILIGNFGDGKIHAFDPATGKLQGTLRTAKRKPLVIDGLWALSQGGALNSSTDAIYFTAGPNSEADGLFGSVTVQPTQ